MRKYSIIALLFMLCTAASGQEILSGLAENPAITKALKNEVPGQRPAAFKSSVLDIPKALVLPFFDDFKQTGIYPDTARWMDNYVYVNKDFPLLPPTWGAATFDAVNQFGRLYPNANPLQFEADKLTSRPIRLDSIFDPVPQALTPADSVYFSFYYQPQGVGNDPQPQDSLVLAFGYYTGNFVFDRIDSIAVDVSIYNVDTIFPGDMLISPCDTNLSIRILDTLVAGDTVMLPCDSVLVPETRWERVWSSKGMSLDSFRIKIDSFYFAQVFIPITDSSYFRNDFQFRFFNYASISNENLQSWQSNCDYWSIDYVLLDRNRSRLDTTHRNITFTGRAESLLENYTSMPAYQYLDDPIGLKKRVLTMYISNLDDGNQTANYFFKVFNQAGKTDTTMYWDGGSGSLLPYNQSRFTEIPSLAYPGVRGFFKIPGNQDSAWFDVKHYLVGDNASLGDTLTYRQKFYNYYAYDDGSPEFGYGLSPAGSQLAYRFELSRRDTLRAIDMYFNKTLTEANVKFFNLAVWNDLDGRPGDIIYLQEREKPVLEDSLYRFHTYHLDSALPVQGTIYVGWIQLSDHNLNVGFDANNDVSDNIYYNVTGNKWERSIYNGALMIRPVLGTKLQNAPPLITKSSLDFFRVVPNPTKDGQISLRFYTYPGHSTYSEQIQLSEDALKRMEVLIYNMMGQKVYQSSYMPTFNLSHINYGMYVMRLVDYENKTLMSQKLWIQK